MLATLDQDFLVRQTRILCASYRRWTGLPLLEAADEAQAAVDQSYAVQALFDAPFAVASHDAQADPLFNYANRSAQRLFGMDWQEIIGLPSRYSAEPVAREERDRLLARVAEHGYVDDYCGIRIAKDGSRFMLRNATVWNLLDEQGNYCGQAALIHEWQPL